MYPKGVCQEGSAQGIGSSAEVGANALSDYVAQDLPLFGGGERDNQFYGGDWGKQGFLFSQLGKLKASTRALYDSSWRSCKAISREEAKRGGDDKGGRFSDKGGQQVNSVFLFSTDNEKIKVIYGNYCFWSWLRYWHLDSADFITLLLMDKGYYDYDYAVPDEKTRDIMNAAKSDDELKEKLSKLGFGKRKKKPATPEELQQRVWEEENKS